MAPVIETGNTRVKWVRGGRRGEREDFILGPVDFQYVYRSWTQESDLTRRYSPACR